MMHSKSNDIALLLLRITFGGLMIINHGWGKMMRLFGEGPIKFADPIGLGPEISLYLTVFAEVICGVLLIIGLFTRYATIPLIITMLVALFVIHGDDPFGDKEGALVFLIPYICLLIAGPGEYSVDKRFRSS